jgi:hypothetical protein
MDEERRAKRMAEIMESQRKRFYPDAKKGTELPIIYINGETWYLQTPKICKIMANATEGCVGSSPKENE